MEKFEIGDIYYWNSIPTFLIEVTKEYGTGKVIDITGSSGWQLGAKFSYLTHQNATLKTKADTMPKLLKSLDKLKNKLENEKS